jgi:NAD(P)-dependent dehydrogenase (short-subunit alcohol dehydrogenase family)
MDSKTIFITGATNGIGKDTAKALAQQGHFVVIHGRDTVKTQAVCEEIKSETGSNTVDYLIADLLSLSEVRRMADEFKKKYDRLDVLINNAGAVFNRQRETTKEGLEKTMTLNLFAPFLLAELLLEVLEKSPSARIINVASVAHKMGGKPDLSDIQSEKIYANFKVYGLSKLYLIWITHYLSDILIEKEIKNITVNTLHPGVISSGFGNGANKGLFVDFIFKLSKYLLTSAKKGAETSVYLATSNDVENVTGKYFNQRQKITETDKRYDSAENRKIVWNYCMQIVKPYFNE